MIDRRAFLETGLAAATSGPLSLASTGPVFRPEDFGAKGDGRTNDGRAFASLSAELNRSGGGTIVLGPNRAYIIGEQHRGGPYGWTPAPALELSELARPLRILGNHARLICAPSLRYGTFDVASDLPVHRPMPNYRPEDVATPYRAMISISRCNGPVEVRDLELDGNVGQLRIGGQFGDSGWQLPASGLVLDENIGPEIVENVHSHHHAQDGAIIIGAAERTERGRIRRLLCRVNGRQGLSIVAGGAYDFADCEFSRTGRSIIRSAPGAGVDIEAERRPINDLRFTRCRFVDNAGPGMVADSGDSENARFDDCLFVGTTMWSVWPNRPNFLFRRCTFVGSVVRAYADPDPGRATRFAGCRFTDDPNMSPTRKVYVGNGPIVNLELSENVLFNGCRFDLVGDGILPWTWRAIYRNCTMRQRSPITAMPKGRYIGRSVISGNVDLYGAMIQGELIVNGRLRSRGPQGVEPW